MRAHIEAMRALAYTNAIAIDLAKHAVDPDERTRAAELADLLTPITKAWCTDVGSEVARLGTQIHGGMGYVERDRRRAARPRRPHRGHLRGHQRHPGHGPRRAQAADARRRRARRPARRHGGDGGRARRRHDSPTSAPHLADGVAALREATDWLLANGAADPQNALAGATPYLRLFGTVVAGWFLARQALAAPRRAAAGDEFLQAKVATARYFAQQVLPTARGLLPSVTAGPDVLFALSPEQLASS